MRIRVGSPTALPGSAPREPGASARPRRTADVPSRGRGGPGTHRTPGVSPACAGTARAGRAPSGPNPSANSVGGREDGRTVALATLHRQNTVVRCATSPRSRLRAPRRALVVAAAVAGLLAGTPVVAGAAPAPAVSERDALAERVATIEEQVRA